MVFVRLVKRPHQPAPNGLGEKRPGVKDITGIGCLQIYSSVYSSLSIHPEIKESRMDWLAISGQPSTNNSFLGFSDSWMLKIKDLHPKNLYWVRRWTPVIGQPETGNKL
jgi:hypothetical protein